MDGVIDEVSIRPMRQADLPIVEQISDEAFWLVDLEQAPRSAPEPTRRSPERSARWITRTARFLDTDPGGCWVAEADREIAGFSTSIRRGELWVLVTFATRPAARGQGVGKALLDASLAYGAKCSRSMLSATDDPAALRRYHSAGFSLHPQLTFVGTPDVSELPPAEGIRPGTAADLEWIDALDERLRGGPHGPDHEALAAMAPLFVDADRAGYVYTTESETFVVAADDETTATRLLTWALRNASGRFVISHVTTANGWAIDLAMAARLSWGSDGYLGLRGLAPPTPYLHNGSLL